MKQRTITLFTGQWADLSITEMAPLAKKMGYEGLELACWGDHFDVTKALNEPDYIPHLWKLLGDNGLDCLAISNHLVGQAVCDPIDARHQQILSDAIWGDGDPEGVRQRAAEEMKQTARAARKFFNARPGGAPDRVVVNGFTGSSIWPLLYSFPPVLPDQIENGYKDFADRFIPILDVFEEENVDFALEVHPTEIAFDIASAERALAAVNHHPRFGFNYDPSHLGYQGVDYIKYIYQFKDRIYHCHVKDAWWGHSNGDAGVFGGHTDFGDPRRYWDFRSPGRGDVEFEEVIVALNDIAYTGPLSVEWEDSRMDRVHGATEGAEFVRDLNFAPNPAAFDSVFSQ
ncbi:MAG: sugar phosphate isomerase/epimerase [Verrucomicrobiota bacterium]